MILCPSPSQISGYQRDRDISQSSRGSMHENPKLQCGVKGRNCLEECTGTEVTQRESGGL